MLPAGESVTRRRLGSSALASYVDILGHFLFGKEQTRVERK
jgi:hypothetical protein